VVVVKRKGKANNGNLTANLLTPRKKKKVEKIINTIEEAFLMKGTEEGNKLAEQLTKATGFLMEYTLLKTTDKSIGSQNLKEEAQKQGYDTALEIALTFVNKAKATKKSEYLDSDMKDDFLFALSLYTCDNCYPIINKALRSSGSTETMLRFSQFTTNFIKGFRLLPSYWGNVFRGTRLPQCTLLGFQVGKSVLFEGFTSASKDLDKAKAFINSCGANPNDQAVIFTMTSRSGRCLQDLSCYDDEQEVVFRPFTTFTVVSVEVKDLDGIKTHFIVLTETHPDIRGRKVLVWIDDVVGTDSKQIMDHCERDGVTFVNLHSTKETEKFFKSQGQLLKRANDKMRIITDMVRTEDGQKDIEAGIKVATLLKEELKYDKPILCYTGERFLESNREKLVKANLKNVFATADPVDAVIWAKFQGVPKGIETL